MNRSALDVMKAAVHVLQAAVSGEKQLLGEAGVAEEATDDYREELILILLAWIAANSEVPVLDELAVNAALDSLAADLGGLAAAEIPKAFEIGFGRRAGRGQDAVIGTAVMNNSAFVQGSLVPYIAADFTDPELVGLTIGDVAVGRSLAWSTRVGLYAGTYWTSVWLGAQESLRDKLDLDTVPVRRLLDPRADHCGTCPGKAQEYGSWNEMLAFTGGLPADGSDDCHSNCRCTIELFVEGEWVGIV